MVTAPSGLQGCSEAQTSTPSGQTPSSQSFIKMRSGTCTRVTAVRSSSPPSANPPSSPRGLPRPSFFFSLGRIWLEESPGDPWIRTIHPSGGGLCAPPHPSRGFLSVACGAESSRPSRPGVRASVPASCHDATEKLSLFPGGLSLPEVLHVRASAPFKSSFSAPEEARASPGSVPVSGASRCSHCLMMSLLWSSPCRCRVAYLKVRILTNLGGLQHQLLVASVWTHGAVDGVCWTVSNFATLVREAKCAGYSSFELWFHRDCFWLKKKKKEKTEIQEKGSRRMVSCLTFCRRWRAREA